MIEVRAIADLVGPRFTPYSVVGVPVAAWYDQQEDRYLVLCPSCLSLIAYDEELALHKEMVWSAHRCCQGCRARASFAANPGLIGAVLEVWRMTGTYPQSASWIEAIPWYELMLRSEEIETALQAATAPAIDAGGPSGKRGGHRVEGDRPVPRAVTVR